VIIGFSNAPNINKRQLYINNAHVKLVENINPYLVDAPSILIESRRKSICDAPPISYGSMPIDDGYLILDKKDIEALLAENSTNIKFIKKYAGGTELINNKERWCLWLQGISPKEIQSSKIVMERIKSTAEFRRQSDRAQTKALAETPTVFGEVRQPDSNMLVIPKVSSENRRYIPISFVKPEVIINGSALIISSASLYHFGILNSNVHMSWMRSVAGRMKSDYQYSGTVVYNNFPWVNPTEKQKKKIEKTAQLILEARNKYSDCSLADLYDSLAMPPELRKAHQENDIAVMEAYGFPAKSSFTESMCVAELMKMYAELAKEK